MAAGLAGDSRKGDISLPGQRNANSHGARPVHQIISMITWIRTSKLSIKISFSAGDHPVVGAARLGRRIFHGHVLPGPRNSSLEYKSTTSQKFKVVPRRARM